jgi:hypothetical protein
MILFASSSQVNSIMMDDADFMGADLESHPIYLILANEINGLLSYSSSSLTLLNFIMSINLIYILCAMMPYVGTLIKAPFPILPNQSLANCLSALASLILVVLMLKSPLFS